jgi:hypothetical protein
MCLVTFLAVSFGLLGKVWFMAISTFRDFTMSVMAGTAEESRMFALVVA